MNSLTSPSYPAKTSPHRNSIRPTPRDTIELTNSPDRKRPIYVFILLPPSEGKADGGTHDPFATHYPQWTKDVRPILRHEKQLEGDALRKFYGAKDDDKATAAHKLNQRALRAPTTMAIERYTGVVYQHIDYPTLKKKAAAKRRIHITSALFGLIPADTLIPDYKMPINPWLTRYWKDKNAARLTEAAQGQPILNLLPNSYAKALPLDNTIHIEFRVAGGKKSAGHFGKAIKGKFVRFLIENNITSPKDFTAFQEDGYTYNGHHFIQD